MTKNNNEKRSKVIDQVAQELSYLSREQIDDMNAHAKRNMILVDTIKKSLKGKPII